MKNITEFNDYRDFLAERFELEQKRSEFFSFQYCSNKLSTAKSYLKLVIQKKRHISLNKLTPIAELFKLSDYEKQYFTVLFLKNTTDDFELQNYFSAILCRLSARPDVEHKDELDIEDKDEYVFKGNLQMTIHSLAYLNDFRPEVAWVQSKLIDDNVDDKLIEEILNQFMEDKIIIRDGDGYKPEKFVVSSPNDFDSDQFKVYRIGHKKAYEIVGDVYKYRPCHFQMLSLSLDEKSKEVVFEKYIKFRDELIEISKKCENPETVYLLSNNIFACTKQPEKE